MTDKEFKKLSRAQLLDIIYQFQLQVEKLTEENRDLQQELIDKRLRVSMAGNIAEAALEINNCFRNAQDAADQYLNEIKAIREETMAEREKILSEARSEASEIVKNAKIQNNIESEIEAFIEEYRQRISRNR